MKNYLLNMFSSIQNGQIAKRNFIIHPRKKICEIFLQILWKEGFILGYKVYYKNSKKLKIFLKYRNNQSVIHTIKIISQPGRRVFYSATEIFKINSSKLFIIFFTEKGLKSISDCKKYKIGGEPFIFIN